MSVTQIKNRQGDLVPFDSKKIELAICKACEAVGDLECAFAPDIATKVVSDIQNYCGNSFEQKIPTVEEVQDLVEKNLIKADKFLVAKEYILYRERRAAKRKIEHEKLIKKYERDKVKVIKTDGTKEYFDIKKIKKTFDRAVLGYEKYCKFDAFMEAMKNNIIDDIKTSDIHKLLIKTCIDLVSIENISWQEIAGRFLLFNIYKEASNNRGISIKDIYNSDNFVSLFNEYIKTGLYYKDFYKYYSKADIKKAAKKINKKRDLNYSYTTILSIDKRYLNNPNKTRKELPQEMYMAVALFLAIPESNENRLDFALKLYEECSLGRISLPTPTLINARTNYSQLSSCFKINIDDDLRSIYHAVENMAQISKYGGGIGAYLGNIRCRGSNIRGIKGAAGGVNPWIKVINDTAVAVNQLGARLGAISVTLDIWHADIYDFLDLQTETGDMRAKAFDVFPAISIPDIFMERVENNETWTLFDPYEVEQKYGKRIQDTFNDEFKDFYLKIESDKTLDIKREVKAKDLFKKFLKTTVETGMPYVFFRDTVNAVNPNKHVGNIYATQLCTEICQNTSPAKFIEEQIEDGKIVIKYDPGDLVTCNLASINISKVNTTAQIKKTFPIAMRCLDNVITLNFFPIKESKYTAEKYRSVGLGYLGLAEHLASQKLLAYDSKEARDYVKELFENYAYHTYRSSVDIAKDRGTYDLYEGSEYSKGLILNKKVSDFKDSKIFKKWEELYKDLSKYGVRFAYHSAPAPNTSTAGIVGTTAALLPIYKKYFVETNLSAPTVRVAPKLSKDNFWLYKEYTSIDMNDVIDMISVIYEWIDQSISFEWMIDPSKVSPADLYGYYTKSWKQKIKTVYYVRSLSAEIKEDCISCSG